MVNFKQNKSQLDEKGYSLVENIYSTEEIETITSIIDSKETNEETFRKSEDLFAIRQFHKEVPEVLPIVFNDNFKNLVQTVFGDEKSFITKSIYFDKPEKSNWFVSYHQDLTISVDKKDELEGFQNWTTKQNQFAVQPPIEILEKTTTFRIHLDDTSKENGALKVISESHKKNIYRPETIDFEMEEEVFCEIKKGGVMLMKPLTLHASNRTTNHKRRRVIHIEMNTQDLPFDLKWSEKLFYIYCYYHEKNNTILLSRFISNLFCLSQL